MRNWHRLKNIVPLLLTIGMSADSSAQQMMDFPSFAGPAYMAGPQPAYSATSAQGMPQSFQSNPMISPFDQAYEQHFNTDGLWFKRALGGFGPGSSLNDFYFNIDYTRTKTRQLNGLFGDPTAATFLQDSIVNNAPGLSGQRVSAAVSGEVFSDHSGVLARRHSAERWNGKPNGLGVFMERKIRWQSDSGTYDARAIVEATRRQFVQVTHFSDAVFLEATGGVANPNVPTNLRQVNERRILETQILNARLFDAANAETFGICRWH